MGSFLFIETLEDRRLFSASVSTSSWLVLTKGATFSTETLLNGKLYLSTSEKVYGKTTFNKISAVEIKGTVTSTLETSSVTSYATTDKAGDLISPGVSNTTTIGGTTTTSTTTFSPYEVTLPAKLTAKVDQSFSWTSNIVAGGITTTQSEVFTFRLPSASETTIKVVAGKFKVYLIDVTESTTLDGKTTTATYQEYYAPGTGLVESTYTSNGETGTTELTKFSA